MRVDRLLLYLCCGLIACGAAWGVTPAERPLLGTVKALQLRGSGVEFDGNVELSVEPSFTIPGVRHVANGVSFRNRASESIQLVGVPKGREIVRALLYFNFSDDVTGGPEKLAILFDGHKVIGELIAESADPCWMLTRNHTYRFDVTGLLPKDDPNREYRITAPFDLETITTGENPWNTSETPRVNNEGATLVVLYASEEPGGVLIYDRLQESMFWNAAKIELLHPMLSGAKLRGLLTMIGADGQTGSGYDNSVAGEKGYLDGTMFSGPPAAPCDWDGSARWPLGQLWDVHTHVVEIGGTSSMVEYEGNGDCLVPVAFVLEAPVL